MNRPEKMIKNRFYSYIKKNYLQNKEMELENENIQSDYLEENLSFDQELNEKKLKYNIFCFKNKLNFKFF